MDLNVVSKHRAPIYGLAILWVVVFHASAINDVDFSFGNQSLWLLKLVLDTGNVGVDIFLFLSGISLYFSFTKNDDVNDFYRKRFLRIVPAVWILFGWFWAYRYLIESFALAKFVPRMMLIDFFLMTNDASIWYVSLILALYAAYPMIYRVLFPTPGRKGSPLSAQGSLAVPDPLPAPSVPSAKGQGVGSWSGLRCLALLAFVYVAVFMFDARNHEYYDTIEIALTRIPVFIIGCYFGKLVYEKKRVPKVCIGVVIACVVLFFAVMHFDALHGPVRRFFYGIGGISIAYLIALCCEAFDKLTKCPGAKRPLYRFLAWTGTFTLELYVAHIMLNQAFRKFFSWYGNEDLAAYAIMAVCAFFLAFGVSKLVTMLKRE